MESRLNPGAAREFTATEGRSGRGVAVEILWRSSGFSRALARIAGQRWERVENSPAIARSLHGFSTGFPGSAGTPAARVPLDLLQAAGEFPVHAEPVGDLLDRVDHGAVVATAEVGADLLER